MQTHTISWLRSHWNLFTHRTWLSVYPSSVHVSRSGRSLIAKRRSHHDRYGLHSYPSRYTTLSRTPDRSLPGSLHTHLSASSSTGDDVLPKGTRLGWTNIGHVTNGAAYGEFLPSFYLPVPSTDIHDALLIEPLPSLPCAEPDDARNNNIPI